MDPLLTAKDVAGILRVHQNTVYEMARKGEIPSVRAYGKGLRFREEDIRAWLEKRSRRSSPLFERLPEFHLDLEEYDKIFLKGAHLE